MSSFLPRLPASLAGCLGLALITPGSIAQVGFALDWSNQIGEGSQEWDPLIAPDGSGGYYMAAHISGNGFGGSNVDGACLIARLGPTGQVLWTRRVRPGNVFWIGGIASLGSDGFVVGGADTVARLVRFDSSGQEVWVRDLNTQLTVPWEAYPVVDAAGDIVVAAVEKRVIGGVNQPGHDVLIRKFTPAGDVVWSRYLGDPTIADYPMQVVATPDAGVYLSGMTFGSLPGFTAQGFGDAYVCRLDSSGDVVWLQQFGSAEREISTSCALAPDGGVYVAGGTGNFLGQPPIDGFVTRFDSNGVRGWTLNFATPSPDHVSALAVDPDGRVFAAGLTEGAIFGQSTGGRDVWLASITPDGMVSLIEQFGSTGGDSPRSLIAPLSNKPVLGATFGGSWAGTLAGSSDIGLARFEHRCRADATSTAIPGQPGYGVPNGALNNDDFFYYLIEFAAGNLPVCDLTTTATPGSPGHGIPNGVLNNDDFFFYLIIFSAAC